MFNFYVLLNFLSGKSNFKIDEPTSHTNKTMTFNAFENDYIAQNGKLFSLPNKKLCRNLRLTGVQ